MKKNTLKAIIFICITLCAIVGAIATKDFILPGLFMFFTSIFLAFSLDD